MEDSSRNWTSWGLPLVAGFLLSTASVAILVPPRASSLSWSPLIGHSAGLLALAALFAVAGVWAMHRVFNDYLGSGPTFAVVACAWSAAIWLPLLLLLRSEHAVWVIAAPIPIAIVVTRFVKRQQPDELDKLVGETPSEQRILFGSALTLRPSRIARLALISAVLVQGLIAASALGASALAESLAILLASTLAWGFSSGPIDLSSTRSENRWRRGSVLPCFLLTCIALTPFLRSALQTAGLRQVVLAGAGVPVAPHRVISGTAYTGFILTLPPARKPVHINPPAARSLSGTSLHKEQVIPFDGVYWFYEGGLVRPGPDAPVRRGDPATSNVRSTNGVPLRMEAHQRFGDHIEADCCGGFAVDVLDADNRAGAISVEAVLRDVSAVGHPSHSLGSVAIQASLERRISLYRPAVSERLHFSLAHLPKGFRFNEVTILIHPSHERVLAGARIKVKDFVLEP